MVKDGIEEVKLLHPMSEEQSVLRFELGTVLVGSRLNTIPLANY